YKKIYEIPMIRQLCRIMGVIPIAPYEGRASVVNSLEMAKKKLIEGDLVCIFPEGQITRSGELNEFKSGFETVMQGLHYPIIPVYLHNVWGSIFSNEGGKFFLKKPKKIPYPITVVFGEALPANAKADEVKSRIEELSQLIL
ncbi:MAG: hypothetical protein ACD_73C00490G0001, partial [uncultured bacterium]